MNKTDYAYILIQLAPLLIIVITVMAFIGMFIYYLVKDEIDYQISKRRKD